MMNKVFFVLKFTTDAAVSEEVENSPLPTASVSGAS